VGVTPKFDDMHVPVRYFFGTSFHFNYLLLNASQTSSFFKKLKLLQKLATIKAGVFYQ